MDSKWSTLTGLFLGGGEGRRTHSKISTLTGPMFFQKNMDSKTSTLTGQFFLGRSEYGFKNFHLNWPNVFSKKYGFKNVHLNWPIFFGKE